VKLKGKEQKIGARKQEQPNQNNKTTNLEQGIKKEERKERRIAHEDG